MDASDLSADPQDGAKRSKSWCHPVKQEEAGEDKDNNANYVNFGKLLTPGSSQYYCSPQNMANRQLIEKYKSKRKLKKSESGPLTDESLHSRASLLGQLSRRSSYHGPSPLLSDGRAPKSVMKKGSSSGLSTDSMPCPEKDAPAKSMKRCSFSFVDVREHERIAGDNPCVSSGVPLSLGWGYYQHESISLDDYEYNKGPSRDKIEMMVPAGIRRSMLRDEFGVSVAEMNASMREVNITKRQRRHTVATEHMEGWNEVLQSAKRKFKRFVKKTSTAKEEEKMWAQAHKSAMAEYLKKNGEDSLGKNPADAGCGGINKGPRIVPANGAEKPGNAPLTEISFQSGHGEGEVPAF